MCRKGRSKIRPFSFLVGLEPEIEGEAKGMSLGAAKAQGIVKGRRGKKDIGFPGGAFGDKVVVLHAQTHLVIDSTADAREALVSKDDVRS